MIQIEICVCGFLFLHLFSNEDLLSGSLWAVQHDATSSLLIELGRERAREIPPCWIGPNCIPLAGVWDEDSGGGVDADCAYDSNTQTLSLTQQTF